MKAQRQARFNCISHTCIEDIQAFQALHSAGLRSHQPEEIWTLLPSIEGDETAKRWTNNRSLLGVVAQVVPSLELRQQLIAQEADMPVIAVILASTIHGWHKHGYYRWNSAQTYQVVKDGGSLAHAQVITPIMKVDAWVRFDTCGESRWQVEGVGTLLLERLALDGFLAQH